MAVVTLDTGASVATILSSGALTTEHSLSSPSVATVVSGGDLVIQEYLAGIGFQVLVYDRAAPSTLLGYVTNWETLAFEDVMSDVGVGTITMKTSQIDRTLIAKDHVWRIVMNGKELFGFTAKQVEDVLVGDSDNPDVPAVKITGPGLGDRLTQATIYPAGWGTDTTAKTRSYLNRSRGFAYSSLLTEAQARGVLTEVVKDNWNGTKDSEGVAWTDANIFDVTSGSNMLELLKEFAETVPWDWHMDSRFRLRLAKDYGRDLSQSVVLYPGNTVTEQATTKDRTDLSTVILAEDAQGNLGEYKLNPQVTAWGRREKYVVFDSAVDSSSRSYSAYTLLGLTAKEASERRVAVYWDTPGRKPFINFGLGDWVGVYYPRESPAIQKFRCLAIAMSVDNTGAVTCEVTLESILEQQRRLRERLSGSSEAQTDQFAAVVLYGTNAVAAAINTSKTGIINLGVQAWSTTYGKVGIKLRGNASAALTVTLRIEYDGTVVDTFEVQVPRAGLHTIGLPYFWSSIPGDAIAHQVWLTAETNTGTFTVAAQKAQFWIEGKNLSGGIGENPSSNAIENPPMSPVGVATSGNVKIWTPIGRSATDSVDEVPVVVDDINSRTGAGLVVVPTADADDGWTSSVPAFTTAGPTLQAGNSAGEVRTAFVRFDIGVDLAGINLARAELRFVPDANMAVPAELLIRCDSNGLALSPTSRADLFGRTWLATTKAWSVSTVTGTMVTVDITAVIQDLITNGGPSITSVLLQLDDDGSPTDSFIQFRSKAHSTGPVPTLIIGYQ
jgi:hypothetical protein